MLSRGTGALLTFGLAAALLTWTASPLSDHPDTLRDWYAARDCAERGQCLLAGSATSFGGLQNGTLFPGALAGLVAAGLDLPAAWWSVVVATALATVGVWLAGEALRWRGAALGAAVAVALWAANLSTQTLWAPAFAPILGSVAGLWGLARPARGSVGVQWALGLGLAGGLLIDCHPMATAAWAGWWLALGLHGPVAARVLRLAIAAGAATGLGWAIAPVAVESNLRIAGQFAAAQPLVVLVAAAAAVGLTLLVRKVQDEVVARLIVAATVPLAVAAGGRIATGHELHPRYLAAAAPALAWWLASAWPWSPRSAASAAVIVVGATTGILGRGWVSNGHTWAQVTALAPIARDAGLRWPQIIGQVQSHGCRKVAAALGGALPSGPATAAAAGLSLQIVDLPASLNPGNGWSLLPAASVSGLRAWARIVPGWLHSDSGRVCVRADQLAQRCEPIQPGITWGPSGAPAVWPDAPLHTRAYPRLTSLAPPDGMASETSVEVGLASPGGTRLLRVLDLPDRRCPWRLADAGPCAVTAVKAGILHLQCSQRADGMLRFARNWGPGCDDNRQWAEGPPCLVEGGPADAQWLAEVAVP